MTTLEARITELRDAAQSLTGTADNVRNAVNRAHQLVDGLVALGFQSPAATVFFETYRRERTVMDTWPDELDVFATGLDQAADAIEEAARREAQESEGHEGGEPIPVPPGSSGTGSPPPSPGGTSGTGTGGTSGTGHGTGSGHSGTGGTGGTGGSSGSSSVPSAPPEPEPEAPEPEPPPLEAYANSRNQELLTEMQQQQTELDGNNATLSALNERRSALVTELDDLTARLTTPAGVTPNARLRGLQEQIAAIDRQIADVQNRSNDLQTSIQNLQTRLERVSPGAGADLNLIASLEGSHTSAAILNATHQADNSVNCVNWVCSRMPIPPGIPNNAYLWPENALRHPEYGIKMGDVPLAGSVMVMQPEHSFADDRFGHVLYVERVDPNGNVWVSDNFNHEPVLLSSLTDEVSGPNITYMYFPWQTQG